MASSSTPKTMRLTKTLKGHLYNDKEAIQAYYDYMANGKVKTGAFAIFEDFPSYDLHSLFIKVKSKLD